MLSFPITLLLLLVGILGGTIAGLLGLGGGIIMNPICLVIYQRLLGIESSIVYYMVAGTNFFVVSFFSLFGVFRYYLRGLVLWKGVFRIGLFCIIGAFLGSSVATKYFSSENLFRLFGIIVLLGGIKMFYKVYPRDEQKPVVSYLPLAATGLVTAFVAAMVGVGGGLMTLPIMIFLFHFPVEKIPGTASGIIFFTSIAGMAAKIMNGWNNPLLPEYSLGYVYLPTGIPLIAGALIGIIIGTKLNERFSLNRIRKIFGLLLILAFIKISLL